MKNFDIDVYHSQLIERLIILNSVISNLSPEIPTSINTALFHEVDGVIKALNVINRYLKEKRTEDEKTL